jgi:hypothetical protein
MTSSFKLAPALLFRVSGGNSSRARNVVAQSLLRQHSPQQLRFDSSSSSSSSSHEPIFEMKHTCVDVWLNGKGTFPSQQHQPRDADRLICVMCWMTKREFDDEYGATPKRRPVVHNDEHQQNPKPPPVNFSDYGHGYDNDNRCEN